MSTKEILQPSDVNLVAQSQGGMQQITIEDKEV